MFKLTDDIMTQLFGAEYYAHLQARSQELANGAYYDVMIAIAAAENYADTQKLLKLSVKNPL